MFSKQRVTACDATCLLFAFNRTEVSFGVALSYNCWCDGLVFRITILQFLML